MLVKLHDWERNTPILINPDHFVVLEPQNANTRVILSTRHEFRVHETIDEILELSEHVLKAKAEPEPEAGVEIPALDDMTISQLKDFAAERGIDVSGATRRDDYIEIIEAALGQPAEATA